MVSPGEIVEITLNENSKKEGITQPYTVNYDVVLNVSLFETTIKLAEAFNISLEEAIMVGVDKMAKSYLDFYVEQDGIKEFLESKQEDFKNQKNIVNSNLNQKK